MLDAEDLYRSLIMDRARAPRHAVRHAGFTAEAARDNPACGDHTQVYVTAEAGRITAVSHHSRGCAIMTASADLMADAVLGLTPGLAVERHAAFQAVVTSGVPDPSLGDLNALAGLHEYRARIGCATLPWAALADALSASADALSASADALKEPAHG